MLIRSSMLLALFSGLSLSVVKSQLPGAALKPAFSATQFVVPVLINKKDNPVIRLQVPVYGQKSRLLSAVKFSLAGSTSITDISKIRVYYTGISGAFQTRNLFGTADAAQGLITITGTQNLAPGNQMLWISIELSPAANLLHKIDAVPYSLVLDGKEEKTYADFTGVSQRIGIALRNAGDDKVNTYRIPGLVTTNSGTLLSVYDIRYNNGTDLQEDIDVGLSRSTNGGSVWEPMKIIMDMGAYGNKPPEQNGIGDPSILVDRNTGTIFTTALWLHGYPKQRAWNASQPGLSPEKTGQLMITSSQDDGKTWSSPINITTQVKDSAWQLCFDGPGRGITMEDGTLVFPAQYKDAAKLPHSTILYSRDHGQSWHLGTGAYPNTTEAQVVETTPGTIMLNMRDNRGGSRTVFTTSDLGKTWAEHPSSRSALIEPVCNASLIKHVYKGKTILFFVNPAATDDRHHMTIKASLDLGLTWPVSYQLLLDELTGNGYPSLTAIDENHLGIVYEGSQAHLVFEKIAIREILPF